jgi:hypothetical protein
MALLVLATPAWAQGDGSLYTRGTLGFFAAFPETFSERWCEQESWGGSAAVGWGLNQAVSVEAGLTAANGLGGITCAIPGIPEPPAGELYAEERYGSGVRENNFRAATLQIVITAWRSGSQRVEGRLGTAWLWNKRVMAGVGGFVYTFRLGDHQLEVGYDAWLMQVPHDLDILMRTVDGREVLVDSRRQYDTDGAAQFTVGYRYRVR